MIECYMGKPGEGMSYDAVRRVLNNLRPHMGKSQMQRLHESLFEDCPEIKIITVDDLKRIALRSKSVYRRI